MSHGETVADRVLSHDRDKGSSEDVSGEKMAPFENWLSTDVQTIPASNDHDEQTGQYGRQRTERIARNNACLGDLALSDGGSTDIISLLQKQGNGNDDESSSSPSLSRSSPAERTLTASWFTSSHRSQHLGRKASTDEGESAAIHRSKINRPSSPLVPRRKRPWNSSLAKQTMEIGRTRKKLDIESFGEISVIHPLKLKNMKVKNGMVEKESFPMFMEASNAFVRHHAQYNCRNYQKKAYSTQCNCMSKLLEGENSDLKIKQVCESLLEFFTGIKSTQKLVIKEWLRDAYFSGAKYHKAKNYMLFTLPGVYHNACPDITSKDDLIPYKVCVNAMAILYNQGYGKIKSLKDDMENTGVKDHGLIGKPSNRYVNKEGDWKELNSSLHSFFARLKVEAMTYATVTILNTSADQLHDEEMSTVELPCSFTKRQFYYRYCYERGYEVKSDSKGQMPALKDYKLRDYNEFDWPVGSVPKVVCSWSYFRVFWRNNYPKITIQSKGESKGQVE